MRTFEKASDVTAANFPRDGCRFQIVDLKRITRKLQMTLRYLYFTEFHAINGYKKLLVSTIIHITQLPFKTIALLNYSLSNTDL